MQVLRRMFWGVIAFLSPLAALAVPITYSFTTGSTTTGDATLAPLLDGLSVSGTFDYDSAASPSLVLSNGSTVYSQSFLNFNGSVGAYSFSDASGSTFVGDEGYSLPAAPALPPTMDILQLFADPALNSGAPPSLFDFAGFDLAGFSLVNVRLFWIEAAIAGAPDFLSGNGLPGQLPGFVGRLALDFTPTSNPGQLSYVFFDGLTVTSVSVPEPGTLSLLLIGGLALGWGRRRRFI